MQRILAASGFGSRRQCEELIIEGRVDVNRQTVTELGTVANLETDDIRVDGTSIKPRRLVYYAVNKPTGVVTTNRDPQGRPRVIDLVPPDERVFPVGRLDRSSEGLILLTNDGDLAQALSHPKYGIRKRYLVTVAGKVDPQSMRQMRKGIHIAEGFVRVEGVRLLRTRGRATDLEIVLAEGKNREIRRILARLGHKVQTLRRVAVGTLRLGDMPPGAYRSLTPGELDKLRELTTRGPDEFDDRDPDAQSASRQPSPKRRAANRRDKPGSVSKRRPTGGQPNPGKTAKFSKPTKFSKPAKFSKPPKVSSVKILHAPGQNSTNDSDANAPSIILPDDGESKPTRNRRR